MTSTEPAAERGAGDATAPEPNLRPTRQRIAVAEALATFDDFRSTQQIHDLLTRRGQKVGLATVYRTLAALAEAGVLDVLRGEDGESIYRRCSATHHHHLVCRICGATVEVEAPAVERWTSTIAREHGYGDISHELEIFGTCSTCRDEGTADDDH